MTVLEWPAVSPDLNPIEHVWALLKMQLRKRPTCRNADHLFETLNELWEEISPQYLRSLTHSMRCRITAVIDSDGGHTKY